MPLTPGPAAHEYQDWAPYPDLGHAAAAYLRDPGIAMDALGRVIDRMAVQVFSMECALEQHDSWESLYQEIALTDGRRLVLWMESTT
jgi:hypothetical protein